MKPFYFEDFYVAIIAFVDTQTQGQEIKSLTFPTIENDRNLIKA